MAWRYSAALDDALERWAQDKSPEQVLELLEGLIDLADCPLTQLPGMPRSALPLRRWARLDAVLVSFYADEAHGVIDIGYLEDG